MLRESIIILSALLTLIEPKGISVRLIDSIIENYDSTDELFRINEVSDVAQVKNNQVNEDAKLNTLELLRKYGFPAESHEVISQDGYILALHRIPHGRHNKNNSKSKPVVLLHHGLLCSSADWLMNTVDKALGYRLADEGYDVWMANARGNRYSRRHVTLSPDEDAFWNFSFHEMGVYDVIAEIDYILAITGESQINYIGHSMGTGVFWVAMSEHPEYNSKIRVMFALGPATYLRGIESPIKHLKDIATELQFAERVLGPKELMPNYGIFKELEKILCTEKFVERLICENLVFLICGFDRQQLNETMIPVISAHTPAGTSTHNVVHAFQVLKYGKFRQFDYGRRGNVEHYGSESPPTYNISKVTAKVAIFYGQNDWLTVPADALDLAAKLPNTVLTYEVKWAKFSHLDFMYAIDSNKLLYNDLLRYLREL